MTLVAVTAALRFDRRLHGPRQCCGMRNPAGFTLRTKYMGAPQPQHPDPRHLLGGRRLPGLRKTCKGAPCAWLVANPVRFPAGFTLRTKYKGHHNRNTQIRGTFSADGAFLVCGSDDGWVYVWPSCLGPEEDKLAKQVGKKI